MEQNAMTDAIVTSISEMGDKIVNDFNLHFIPAACYVYTVGENTLNQTKDKYGL
jgi:hypothetical protein